MPTLGSKDVAMDNIEDALAVQAVPVRLAQILNNLIANYFKYGDNFLPIQVSAHARDDGFGRIEITNTGPGIPAAERLAVFLPFRQSEAVGRSVPGGRSGPVHRQASGRGLGRADQFQERTRPPDPLLDRAAAGGLNVSIGCFISLPLDGPEPLPYSPASVLDGRVAQRESTPFTREGSQVQSLSRPPMFSMT